MTPILLMDSRRKNLERLAARYRLYFHVDTQTQTLVPHTGDSEDEREATDEELLMWERICTENLESFVANPEEVVASWRYLHGPFTVNAEDLAVIRGLPSFSPCTTKEELMKGQLGFYTKGSGFSTPIYVSRAIPVGFFYLGPRVPEIHWTPSGTERELEPSLPLEVNYFLIERIKPFTV
jgi:radical SAM superfamily enzyme YgiQ (UPF0313 family)